MKKGSKLEEKFLWLWKSIGGPELERELKFIAGRRFRADFAHIKSRCLIEIEGGVFVRGRHLRPSGYINDCEKYNLAALNGWTVFRLTPPQITVEDLEAIRNHIQTKA